MKFQCKWKKYILLVTAILLVSVFSVLMVLKADYGYNFILSKINKSIPGDIFVEKLEFSILKGEFNLYNILIKGASDEKLIGFKKFYFNFSWIDLFKSQITFKNIKLEAPFINLSIDKEKNLNLLSAFLQKKEIKDSVVSKEYKGEFPFNIVVKNLQIIGAKFFYEDMSNDFTVSIDNISLNANADIFKKNGQALLDFGKGVIKKSGFSTRLDHMNIKCGIKNGKITPLYINGAADFFQIVVKGEVEDIFNCPDLEIDILANINLDKIQDNLNKPESKFTGETTLTIALKGVLNNLDIKIAVDYTGGIIAGSKVDKMSLNMDLVDKYLNILNFDIKTEEGILKLIGKINMKTAFPKGFDHVSRNLEEISYNLSLNGKNLHLTNLPKLNIDWEKLNGAVSLNALVKGKGISPSKMTASLKGSFKVDKFNINALKKPLNIDFKGEADIRKGLINISETEMTAEDTTLHFKGLFHTVTKDFHGKLDLFTPHIEKPLSSFGIDNMFGKLLIDADISSEQGNIDGYISASGEKLLISDIYLGNINIDAKMEDNGFILKKIHLKNKKSELFMDGFLTLFAPNSLKPVENPEFKLNIRGDKLYIKNFIEKYDGVVSLTGNIKGTKKNLQGDLDLDIKGLFLEGQKIDHINIPITFSKQEIQINPFYIEIQKGETLTGSGVVSFDKKYEIELFSEDISLDSIAEIKKQGVIKGLLQLNVSGKGTFDNPQLEAKIDFKKLLVSEKPLEDFHINLTLKDQVAKLSGKLNFDIDSSYHLDNKDFEASVLFDNTSFVPYFKIADKADLNGNITGRIKAKGNFGEIDKIQGDAEITDFNLGFKNSTIINSKKIIGRYKNGNFTISEFFLKLLEEGSLNISGTGNINGAIDLNGKGKIPLQIISVFSDDLNDMAGSLNLNAAVTGTLKKPDVQGLINLEDIQFTVPGIYQKIHKLNGQIDITPEKIELKSFTGFFDSGKFNIEGLIDYENLLPVTVDILFKAKLLPIKIPDTLDVVVNSEIKFSGTDKKSLVEGKIVLIEGIYYKDIDLNPFKMALGKSLSRHRSEAPLTKEMNQGFLKNMGFDIDILKRGTFIIENNLASMEIEPDLNLKGSIDNPMIIGRASVLDGEVYCQQKKFIINKGVVDFINPYKIKPEIDIESQAEIRDWIINLNISGTPEELSFIMKSEPYEETNDILSLIMFGKTNRELINGEGGTNLSTAQMVAEMIGATFGDDIRKTTGLDIFELEVEGSEGETTSDNIKVTIGEEITRRLTMKYELEYEEGENIQRGISEYRLLENFYLNGYQDTKGDFGCQMLFKLEFR